MGGNDASGAATDAVRVEECSFSGGREGSKEGELRVDSRAGGLSCGAIGRFETLVLGVFVNIQAEVSAQG